MRCISKTITVIGIVVVLCAEAYAQDMPPPQITAEKAVELAREYVIGADTVAAKAIKTGEPKLAPLPRDTNVPLDSLLFPDLLLDRPAWAIDIEGFITLVWGDKATDTSLPDKTTAYIDAETGRLLKVTMVDGERFEPSSDTTSYSLVTLFASFRGAQWSLPSSSVVSLEGALGRGDFWVPFGALQLSAYYVQVHLPPNSEHAREVPPDDEPVWMIGIKWRSDIVPAAEYPLRPDLRPGWTFVFLEKDSAVYPPKMLQRDVPVDR